MKDGVSDAVECLSVLFAVALSEAVCITFGIPAEFVIAIGIHYQSERLVPHCFRGFARNRHAGDIRRYLCVVEMQYRSAAALGLYRDKSQTFME